MNAHKRFDDAIEIFKLNVAERPRPDGSLFLLADAFQRAGKRELAVKNYEAALMFMVFEKIMQGPFYRSRSDHVSLARLFKANGIKLA